jgi:[acyl-carrier-protein] S-malonyltransferase
VVVSGEAAAVAKAGELAAARGGKFTALKVSGAFHSPLVAPAAERMKGELAAATVAAPRGTFLPNVTAAPAATPAAIRDALYRQIASPVRWRATMDYMLGAGAAAAVEFGHGRVLAGLFKKVKRDLPVFNVADEASADAAAAALGRLARGE